jgi:hypothetical protein
MDSWLLKDKNTPPSNPANIEGLRGKSRYYLSLSNKKWPCNSKLHSGCIHFLPRIFHQPDITVFQTRLHGLSVRESGGVMPDHAILDSIG